jgi:hypothetical protein
MQMEHHGMALQLREEKEQGARPMTAAEIYRMGERRMAQRRASDRHPDVQRANDCIDALLAIIRAQAEQIRRFTVTRSCRDVPGEEDLYRATTDSTQGGAVN